MVHQIQNMPAQFVPTEEQRKIVRAMSAYGIPQHNICKVVGISPKTLSSVWAPLLIARFIVETGAVETGALSLRMQHLRASAPN